MRITDCRYDRDRLRLEVAYRLISHEVRTALIRQGTGLSADRIRRLFRDYVRDQPQLGVRRRRGKSPRQMGFFRRSPRHELETATLACILLACGLLGRPGVLDRLTLEEIARFCDAYDTFSTLCPGPLVSFEHAWYLLQVLARDDEYGLARCSGCQAPWVRDRLDLEPHLCPSCRTPALVQYLTNTEPAAIAGVAGTPQC
jgi:hypothetical protein